MKQAILARFSMGLSSSSRANYLDGICLGGYVTWRVSRRLISDGGVRTLMQPFVSLQMPTGMLLAFQMWPHHLLNCAYPWAKVVTHRYILKTRFSRSEHRKYFQLRYLTPFQREERLMNHWVYHIARMCPFYCQWYFKSDLKVCKCLVHTKSEWDFIIQPPTMTCRLRYNITASSNSIELSLCPKDPPIQ